MKTKNIKNFISFILLAVVLSSCEDFLNIEPQQSVSDETVYSDHEGVVNALYGAYERIATGELFAGTGIFYSDLLANTDDITWLGTFIGYRQMNWKSLDPNDATIRDKWAMAYQAINICNNVLANLDVVREADQARVEGEAKFVRGIVYFELVRFFALPYVDGTPNSQPGVPIVLTPTTAITADDFVSRSSVTDVYDVILDDLTDAKTLLAGAVGTGSGANAGRATGPVASAYLARVYLAMENWEAAANEANTVISSFGGAAALNDVPRQNFNNDSYTSEDVFMIQQNAISHAGQANDGIATFFASLPGMGRGDVQINSTHLQRYESDDLRATITEDEDIVLIAEVEGMFYEGVGTRSGNIMSSKWGKHDANIPVIRLAEMFLTRAEANFRNGSSIGADPIDDINEIRGRANAPFWGPEDLSLQSIWEERQRELAFEGHLLHDLRRFRGSVVAPAGSPHVGETIEWNDGRLVLPIPQREIDTNENLEQNEAYVN